MKIYVPGGIAGLPDRGERQFRRAEQRLVNLGHEVVVPLDISAEPHPEPCPEGYAVGPEHSSACHLRADLKVLLECDAILMLSGWELSRGARLEHAVAADCGLLIYYPESKISDNRMLTVTPILP